VEMATLVQQARQQVSLLTGMPAEAVTGLRRDDGAWTVTVEALELSRVPSTMDVLGTYEIRLSDEGRLLDLRLVARHRRSATEHGGS
jgi:hypothetical protein